MMVPSPQELQDHGVFRALMWALARPGEPQPLVGGLEAVGRALLDLETRFHTPDPALQRAFLRLGAQAAAPAQADYLFLGTLDEAALEAVAQAPTGSLLYPEGGATIALVGRTGYGPLLRLRGPGIHEEVLVQLGLPPVLWSLRAQRVAFPLGWDLLVLEPAPPGWLVRAIPRSVTLEVV